MRMCWACTLGRTPPARRSSSCTALSWRKAYRYTVALEVLQLPAAKNLVVEAAYPQLLNRAANSSDIAYWTNQLSPSPAPALTDIEFYSNVVASPEFGFNSSAGLQ